ncbi:unnamed protein product [Rotaria magnacalcarata]|uniref:RGS domain-containing protein n=6 Tax=Rotaria magnacalcarata TaxID=392030 RepID=A0A818Z1H7_9BILA|nr:unnamed protein product [Rotaria magnacalcarata]CAF3762337.1 unnamed protein product [Rotaria magnacalcarata]CAF3784424.1 unnamed protein product [Rotaria magnacalcarata]
MSFSDTECSHRSSLATVHRVPANSSSQLSRTISIHDIVSNHETAELFLEFLMSSPQTASLGAVYAIVLVLNEKKDNANQLHDIGRAAYKTYIENESILPWLPPQRRMELRETYRRKHFDEHFFDGVLDDLLSYIESQTDVFRQFLNSRIWNEYRRGKFTKNHAQVKSTSTLGNTSSGYQNENNEFKRLRKLHSSSLSLQTKTKSHDRHLHNRSARVESTSIKKTRVAYFLPGSDTPFVIQVAVPPESIVLNDILPRLHTSSKNQRNGINTNTSFDYFVKHRASNENWLGGDTQFINEKVEDFDIPLPNIDGTVMVVLTTDVIVTLAVIGVVLILILLILLICCLCRKCDQCARWSRRTANKKEEDTKDREIAESRREFDQIRQQHNETGDQLRVKYNLNGGGRGDAKTITFA